MYFLYKKPATATQSRNVASNISTAISPVVAFSFKILPKTTLDWVGAIVGAADGESVG